MSWRGRAHALGWLALGATLLMVAPAAAEPDRALRPTVAVDLGARFVSLAEGGYFGTIDGYGYGNPGLALQLGLEAGHELSEAFEVGGGLGYLWTRASGPPWADDDGISYHALEPSGYARLQYRDDSFTFAAGLGVGAQVAFAVSREQTDPFGAFLLKPELLAQFYDTFPPFELRVGYAAPLPAGAERAVLGGLYVLFGIGGPWPERW